MNFQKDMVNWKQQIIPTYSLFSLLKSIGYHKINTKCILKTLNTFITDKILVQIFSP